MSMCIYIYDNEPYINNDSSIAYADADADTRSEN
jgi:hypothetical protein